MWRLAALLVVACACGSKDVPERTNYAPLTAETSIVLDETFVSDLESDQRNITILGDGTVRDADSKAGPGTRLGHASRGEVAHLLNKLESIDFRNLRCRDEVQLDHAPHTHMILVVAGTRSEVELEECGGNDRGVLAIVAGEMRTIARRAIAP